MRLKHDRKSNWKTSRRGHPGNAVFHCILQPLKLHIFATTASVMVLSLLCNHWQFLLGFSAMAKRTQNPNNIVTTQHAHPPSRYNVTHCFCSEVVAAYLQPVYCMTCVMSALIHCWIIQNWPVAPGLPHHTPANFFCQGGWVWAEENPAMTLAHWSHACGHSPPFHPKQWFLNCSVFLLETHSKSTINGDFQ